MKILHTADWHLGDRLGRIDRTDDLRRAVERVADVLQAGERSTCCSSPATCSANSRGPDGLRETIRHWQDVFREFLETGGTILTLTGNHDNENFCQTLVHAMTLAAPTVGKPGEIVPPGRLYLAADPTFLRLEDRARRLRRAVRADAVPDAEPLLQGRRRRSSTAARRRRTSCS